jgi:HAD superfamily hydrolase (TIGR01450 family)
MKSGYRAPQVVSKKPIFRSPSSKVSSEAVLKKIRHIALDMDGTIYLGKTLFPFTKSFLQLLEKLEIGYTLLTNNPSKNSEAYVDHLKKMGVSIQINQLYTSGQAAVEFIQEKLPNLKRWFVLGTPSMKEGFVAAGFQLADAKKEEPEGVLVGYDSTLDYEKLCLAAYWIKKGKPYIATNPDCFCPTDEPTWLIDCGAICAAITTSTGRKPDRVIGKPEPYMIQKLLDKHKLQKSEMVIIGDRLYTDMEMARAAGITGVLVLTGESTREEVSRAHHKPDFACKDLGEFGELLQKARAG